MAKGKPSMNIVFVGHVDAGKSTCVGRMMFDGGAVTEQEMNPGQSHDALHLQAQAPGAIPRNVSRS